MKQRLADELEFYFYMVCFIVAGFIAGVERGDPAQEPAPYSPYVEIDRKCFGDWPESYNCEDFTDDIITAK